MKKSLQGIRILDLTRLLPGPFASLILADMGAQVDKLEEPGVGDYLRHLHPQVGGQSEMFLALNRGKRSLALNLKNAHSRSVFESLILHYDVLIESFRPGVLERFGLGLERLRQLNPRLITVSITGYGSTGPLAQHPGHDLNYLARAGLLGLTGPVDKPPQPPGFQAADLMGSFWATIGILGALRARDQNGQGEHIDVAMSEASIPLALMQLDRFTHLDAFARGQGSLTGGFAVYNTYATLDNKYVAFAALEPKFWASFCEGVGLEVDMNALVPGDHQSVWRQRLTTIFASRTRDTWTQFGEQYSCCLEPVLEPHELMHEPHLQSHNIFKMQATPFGPSLQLRLPVGEFLDESLPPPALGQHTEKILKEIGFTSEQIEHARHNRCFESSPM